MRQFEDLGEPPSRAERQDAEGNDSPDMDQDLPDNSFPRPTGAPRSFGPSAPAASVAEKKRRTGPSKSASSGIPRDSSGRPTDPAQDVPKRPSPPTPGTGVRESQAPSKKGRVDENIKGRTLHYDIGETTSASVGDPLPEHVEKALDHMLEPFDATDVTPEPLMSEPDPVLIERDLREAARNTVPPDSDQDLNVTAIGADNALAAYSNHLQVESARSREYLPMFIQKIRGSCNTH